MLKLTRQQLRQVLFRQLYCPQSTQTVKQYLNAHPLKRTKMGGVLQQEQLFLLNRLPKYRPEQLYRLYEQQLVFDYTMSSGSFIFSQAHASYLIPFKTAFAQNNLAQLNAQETRIIKQLFQQQPTMDLAAIQTIIHQRYPITGHRFPLQQALETLIRSGYLHQFHPHAQTLRYRLTPVKHFQSNEQLIKDAYHFLIKETFLRNGALTLSTIPAYFGLNPLLTQKYVATLIKERVLRLVELTGEGVRYVHTSLYEQLKRPYNPAMCVTIVPLTDIQPHSGCSNDCFCLVNGNIVGTKRYTYNLKAKKIETKTTYYVAISQALTKEINQQSERIAYHLERTISA